MRRRQTATNRPRSGSTLDEHRPLGVFEWMLTHVQCEGCELRLLARQSSTPKPIGMVACPECRGTEFAFVDE